jgi:hypothetical protein
MSRALSAPAAPKIMMIPATTKAAKNTSIVPPRLATMPTAFFASSPTLGCRLPTKVGRSSCASCHSEWTFSPTTGQAATLSGGAGTSMVLSLMPTTRSCIESASEDMSTAAGKTISTMPLNTISVAASFGLPFIRCDSPWCAG